MTKEGISLCENCRVFLRSIFPDFTLYKTLASLNMLPVSNVIMLNFYCDFVKLQYKYAIHASVFRQIHYLLIFFSKALLFFKKLFLVELVPLLTHSSNSPDSSIFKCLSILFVSHFIISDLSINQVDFFNLIFVDILYKLNSYPYYFMSRINYDFFPQIPHHYSKYQNYKLNSNS